MAIEKDTILTLLNQKFAGAKIELTDYAGDLNHYELHIQYQGFKGLSKIQQHKAIYEALGPCVGNELHAISIKSSY